MEHTKRTFKRSSKLHGSFKRSSLFRVTNGDGQILMDLTDLSGVDLQNSTEDQCRSDEGPLDLHRASSFTA